MENIASKDNERVKKLRKLQLKKYRDEYGLFCVENFKIINDAAGAGVGFEEIYFTESFLNKNQSAVDKLLVSVGEAQTFSIADDLNKSFSELNTPSGVCAVYAKREVELKKSKPIVYLNGINDPGNVGAILRTALAFDFENVVLDETCADVYNAKTINAAKDAIFKLNIVFDNQTEILRRLKKEKVKLIGAATRGGGPLKRQKQNFCIIFGSESHGFTPAVEKLMDELITIKTGGKIESLNVAAAAAIILHGLAA
jgi:TrmH family RNA methyltransferase